MSSDLSSSFSRSRFDQPYRARIDRQIRAGLLNTTAKASEVKDQIYPNPLEKTREYRDS
jgi:hypothetical protein